MTDVTNADRPVVRAANAADITQIVELLLRGAEQRARLDPAIWSFRGDGRPVVQANVQRGIGAADARGEVWRVAERSGRVIGVAHASIVPVPPIYAVDGSPGLISDDCYAAPDAPSGTIGALIGATEHALREIGVSGVIASCAQGSAWHEHFEQHGYAPVTLYMAKSGLSANGSPIARPARAEDVPEIVRLSARHRSTLANLNPAFWPTHPEADARFSLWMRHSLTLSDRDMFVSGSAGNLQGYIIAQPTARFLLPEPHDIQTLGTIDDFFAMDFDDVRADRIPDETASALLIAAESSFAARGMATAIAVCPAEWSSKQSRLQGAGYRTAKLWLFKT